MKKNVLFLTVLVLFFGCNPSHNEMKTIGVVGPFTGDGATYGASMKKGADLVFGKNPKYKIIYEDSKLSPKEGVNAVNKLININNVDIIFGAAASSVSLAITPISDKKKIILFSSISTADDLTNAEYFIRNVPKNNLQGETAAKFLINKLGVSEIALFNENDDYGVTIANGFKAEIHKLNGEIVFEDSYLSSNRDFKIPLLKIKESGAQAAFIPGNYKETEIILKQAKEIGLNIIFIGGDGSYSPELIKIAGTAAEGFYCTIMSLNKDLDYYKEFYKLFNEIYNTEPDIYDAYAYEACSIIFNTMENSSTNTDELYSYITSHEFESLTGPINFNKDGDIIRLFGIVKVEQSNFIEINF